MELLLGHIASWLVEAGPWIVFFVVMAETAIFLGLLVPAEATVLLAAVLAEQGLFQLDDVFFATFFGALAGDQVGYALGRWGGIRFSRRNEALGETRERYQGATARLLRRHSLLGITLGRFLSFIRTLMPWFAGRHGVAWPRFFVFDVLGVLGWTVGSIALGYAAGASWHVVAERVGIVGGAVLAVLVVVALVLGHRQGRLRLPLPRRSRRSGRAPRSRRGGRLPRVGLTGNIASGKSSVAEVWRGLGARVVDADTLARRAVAPGTPGLAAVARAFGEDVVSPTGELDRAAMRERIFGDDQARRALEAIVHPEVARLREAEEARIREEAGGQGTPIVVHDVPLLFEVGLEEEFDLLVLVDAPVEERLRRLVEDRGLGREEARRMVEAQMPSKEKRGRSDIVLDNDGTLDALEERARAVWTLIRKRLA